MPNREICPATAQQVSQLCMTSPAIVRQVMRFVVKMHDGHASSFHFQRLILEGIYRGLVGDRSYCVTAYRIYTTSIAMSVILWYRIYYDHIRFLGLQDIFCITKSSFNVCLKHPIECYQTFSMNNMDNKPAKHITHIHCLCTRLFTNGYFCAVFTLTCLLKYTF